MTHAIALLAFQFSALAQTRAPGCLDVAGFFNGLAETRTLVRLTTTRVSPIYTGEVPASAEFLAESRRIMETSTTAPADNLFGQMSQDGCRSLTFRSGQGSTARVVIAAVNVAGNGVLGTTESDPLVQQALSRIPARQRVGFDAVRTRQYTDLRDGTRQAWQIVVTRTIPYFPPRGAPELHRVSAAYLVEILSPSPTTASDAGSSSASNAVEAPNGLLRPIQSSEY